MTDQFKKAAAEAALAFIPDDGILGVGTGSTVNALIELLPTVKARPRQVIASSIVTRRRLEAIGWACSPLESVGWIDVYIDGADEIDSYRRLLKGGGGAHTGEKILAVCADWFVVIADSSKQVAYLGKSFPLPIEVIPMARSYVARQIFAMGATVTWREGVVTDNGNHILDVNGLNCADALAQEKAINQIVGVVDNGLFAYRTADTVIIADHSGVCIKGRRAAF